MHSAPRPSSPSATITPQLDAVVVGAGFSGLYQLHRLRELGLRTRVFEACDDIGGTWYRNRYPGARCDVESTAYSFSFSPELDQEWEWSERYATQPELLRYLHHVADRFDLRKDVVLRTRVTRAVYDEDSHIWQVNTDTGETVTTRFVVLATGCMSAVKEPDIPGVDTFAGLALHTADWPHEGVDLTGRRVAVIGTGCSGVQAIPLLAEQAAGLTVFQRTPVYALPALNRPLTAEETAAFKARYPEFRAAQRKSRGGTVFELPTQSALEVDEAERTATYEAGWESGLLSGLLRTYTDILADRAANETVAEFVRSKIRSIVTDPETAETLSPRTFPFGTKRPCLDTDYYATYNKPHVGVVDLTRTPIVEITPSGVRTSEREHAVDVIVFATGFDAMTGSQIAVDIVGKGGTTLREKWAAGPGITWAWSRPASRTSSRSLVPSARRCSATRWCPSNSMWSGSPTASPTCGGTASPRSTPPRAPRGTGAPTSPISPPGPSTRMSPPGTRERMCRASRAYSWPTRAARTGTGRSATQPPGRGTAASPCPAALPEARSRPWSERAVRPLRPGSPLSRSRGRGGTAGSSGGTPLMPTASRFRGRRAADACGR
ncbi:NAD(P)-binding domain-containing protein [Streptomyces syringium]|uniref:flavin-containing monooxygenase n=1 Tax=Streptomyces syringium TaxID=76729 RepID=UPI003D905AF4